jgi:leader peptidase (prepilin peptidase) / N-methyltransferase
MLTGPDIPIWVGPVCLSMAIGSFAGVLIRRLPKGRRAYWSRSECEACKRKLSPIELVPVASYLALKGRCRGCGSAIGSFDLIIELLGLAVALWAALVDRDPVWLWSTCILGWALLAMAWIDVEHFRLPDILTLPLIIFGAVFHLAIAPDQFTTSLVGALVGYISFRAIALIYRALRGREGLGAGDAKLLAAAGAWVGWNGLPDVVLLAALLAISAVMIIRICGNILTETDAIPFGPFLAASLWLTHLYGPLFFDLL